MFRVWTWSWRLGVSFFLALAVFYAARISLGLSERKISWVRPTPVNASIVLRLGQYKPAALKPPFNAIILLAFPAFTIGCIGVLILSLRKKEREDGQGLA